MKFPLLKVTTDASLVLSLRQQLSTVTVSLQTMTAGKTKMEASYQKDKKNMLVRGGRRERGEGRGGRERARKGIEGGKKEAKIHVQRDVGKEGGRQILHLYLYNNCIVHVRTCIGPTRSVVTAT